MKFILFILALFTISCSRSNDSKNININKDIVDIKNQIQEIDFGDALFNAFAKVQIANDILVISNPRDFPEQVHLINKNNFNYLASTAPIGQGPGEIISLGEILNNEEGTEIYVQDYARYQFFVYNIDSILNNPEYKPTLKWSMDRDIFPITLQMLEDTLSIGVIGMPVSPSEINIQTGFWNMETGKIRLLDNLYSGEEHIRYDMGASAKYNLIVEAHWYQNRIVLRSFDGTEKCRIEGHTSKERMDYYRAPLFVNSNIYLLYRDQRRSELLKGEYAPTKIVVIDLEGNYLKTLETGYYISTWCYDEENNRIIFSFNDEIQFGYLDLDKLDL